ncbi:DUF21 domain-containing protein [Epidermidibacterium keratini]|uniref:DUF21 domain-containing protein n=1 Tax=Epidermidibacterium keratini TaxID=1891644 RepID=A0A7L4YM12_9ACTN|nr:hemolysin family protein [Epidermidibacterium keratini]QHC00092.1 DUF21 domain-containing protein [Epidermidibacterium keratini]
MAVLQLLLGIATILVIIAANGYFVAQEFAYMSVDRSRLGAQADAGDRTAARALSVTRRTSFMLSGAQLGITVTGLLVGFVAEPLVGEALGTLLGGVGVPVAVSVTVGTVLALAVSTVVQMIFGELYPKNLAIAAPEPMARRLARSTTIYLSVFGWLIAVFDKAANGLLRLLKIEPVHDIDGSATAEDLEHIVADSRRSGDLPADLSVMLDRILDFPGEDVEHAMIPRSRVDAVRPDMSVAAVRELMARGHSRYPVIDEAGEVVGVVQLADLLGKDIDEGDRVTSVMRAPLVIPTSMTLPDALSALVGSGNQLACVIDEYGGFSGVLTTEDLAEEIVGEISDEHDSDADEIVVAEDARTWLMDGDVHVDEAERAVGHPLPEGDFETVAGLVISEHGALPERGERVRIELPVDPADLALDQLPQRAIEVEILEIERHVPESVRITLIEESTSPQSKEADDE